MKRKLGKKNIRLFVLFSFLVLGVIGIFGYGIYTAMSFDHNVYKVSSGSFTYDAENSYVNLEAEGELSQKWDKKYYLSVKEKNKSKVINLGNDVVIYHDNDMNLKLYGTNYRIANNGDVVFSDSELEVPRNTSPQIFKLADRRYLVVGKEISTEKKGIDTKGYLIVEIDKSGNALLLNNELNVKTLSTIVLKTSGFDFDVANEKLKLNNKKTIDLKKISGSSNQYVEPEKEVKVDEKDKDNNNNNNNNGGRSTNTNLSAASGATGSAGSNIINNTSVNDAVKLNIVKSAFISSVAAYTSYIDVYYTVNDPKNEYISVFLDVKGTDGYEDRIILNKDLTRNRLRKLTPNTEYSISFGYTYASQGNTDILLEDTSNSFVIRTSKNQTKLDITKISGNRIYYNVKFDPSYAFDYATVVVYSDNISIARGAIDVATAVKGSGYDGFVDCDGEFGYEIVVRLEECKYDGEPVEVDIKFKFING